MVGNEAKLLLNTITTIESDALEMAHEELLNYTKPLCQKVEETELPPFRDINHMIPLIDENKTYRW